jgi:hypothetical protein
MRTFEDEAGQRWVASVREEDTPRHHGRWYLVFHPEHDDSAPLAMLDVRWQTAETGARTLRTMSVFELRRRLRLMRARAPRPAGEFVRPGAAGAADPGTAVLPEPNSTG